MENKYNTSDEQDINLRNVGVRPGPSADLDIDAPVEDMPMPEDDITTPDVDMMAPDAGTGIQGV
jgi:hypothetical protein